MKKYLLIVIILISCKGFAQKCEFELNGKIEGIDSGTIEIRLPKMDSSFTALENKVNIVNGQFTFKGHILYPQITGLFINSDIETDLFFIDAGKQSITIQGDTKRLTSNARTQKEFTERYLVTMASIDSMDTDWHRKYNAITIKYSKIIPTNLEDSMQLVKVFLQNNKDLILMNYIKQNPQSYIGLWHLLFSIRKNGYSTIYDSSYFYINSKLQNTLLGKEIYRKIKNAQNVLVGSHFPSIPITDLNGQKIQLDDKALKEYTFIDFWFSSCGACILQFPELNNIYSKWQNKGFEIISISTDLRRFENDWRKAIKKYNLLWTQYWDIDHLESTELSINFFPTNFLLDKNGKIIAKNIKPKELAAFLELNLK